MISTSDIFTGSLIAGAEIYHPKKSTFPSTNSPYPESPVFTQKLKTSDYSYAVWKYENIKSDKVSWIESHSSYITLNSKSFDEQIYNDWYLPSEKKNIPVYIYEKLTVEVFLIFFLDKGGIYEDKKTSFIEISNLSPPESLNLSDAIYQLFGYEPRILGEIMGLGELLTEAFVYKCAEDWPLSKVKICPQKELIPQWRALSLSPGV